VTVSNALIHSPGKSGVANPLMFNSQRNLHLVAGGPSATLVPAACSTLDRTMPVGAFPWLTIRRRFPARLRESTQPILWRLEPWRERFRPA
jgi:hypothetical protein